MVDYGSNMPQEGDVYHYLAPDGGEIVLNRVDYIDGQGADRGFSEIAMTTGIESAILDCWLGGNMDDDGSQATDKNQWCGNELLPEEFRARGKLLSMLDGRPLTSASIPRLEEAARDDVMSQMSRKVISDVSASVRIVSSTRVDIEARVIGSDGAVYDFSFKGIGQ